MICYKVVMQKNTILTYVTEKYLPGGVTCCTLTGGDIGDVVNEPCDGADPWLDSVLTMLDVDPAAVVACGLTGTTGLDIGVWDRNDGRGAGGVTVDVIPKCKI